MWPTRPTARGPGPSQAEIMVAARVFVAAVVVILAAGVAAGLYIVLVR